MPRTQEAQRIGERITQLRKARDWSQEHLGDLVGVSGNTIRTWEKGRGAGQGDRLVRLAEVFGVHVADLTGATSVYDAPQSSAELTEWADRRLTAISTGLNAYLEKIIEAEVERRIAERVAAASVTPQQREEMLAVLLAASVLEDRRATEADAETTLTASDSPAELPVPLRLAGHHHKETHGK